jgi:hypothetical protein
MIARIAGLSICFMAAWTSPLYGSAASCFAASSGVHLAAASMCKRIPAPRHKNPYRHLNNIGKSQSIQSSEHDKYYDVEMVHLRQNVWPQAVVVGSTMRSMQMAHRASERVRVSPSSTRAETG